MSKELELTDANFEEEVINSDTPVLVDFWAPWCHPCRIVAPIVAEIAEEYGDKIKVGKLNTDDNREVASRLGIMSIPTLMIFKNGERKESLVGVQTKKVLAEKIDIVLNS